MTHSQFLPKDPESFWLKSAKTTKTEDLQSTVYDTVVIGAGITGITLAYLLSKSGVKVALLDASEIYQGTTGHTTAKITAQHGLIYDKLISQQGKEKAKQYYEANHDALTFITRLIEEQQIDCDFSKQDAYVYTNADDYIEKLKKEEEAYRQLGIPGELSDSMPLSLPMKAALKMKDQAQFHPVKYLNALVDAIKEAGGHIYEHAPVVDVDTSEEPVVILEGGQKIHSKKAVLATHFPFLDLKGFYFSRMHPMRSYVVAAHTAEAYPGGMYINAESPSRSVRSTVGEDGRTLLLIGGGGHQTGQVDDTFHYYEELKTFAQQHFKVEDFPYRWSAQDLVTLDHIPYIGHITKNEQNVYVATGYGKWGMTNSTAAALLLSDLIQGKENQYEELFTPSRFNINPSLKEFIVENADVAKHLIKGKLKPFTGDMEDLGPDESAMVMVKGKRAGCYKDRSGNLHVVDTTCTHMGCEVAWNNGERTWDCPCHGSRFSYEGEVMEGPATKPLRKIDLD